MKTLVVVPTLVVFLVGLTACAGPRARQDAGTLMGGVAGGVLGSTVGHGHGRVASIIAGTVLGAIVGNEIGRSIDRADELRASETLERNRTGQPSTWVNPDSSKQVTVTPTRTYQVADNGYCREYTTEVRVGGKNEAAYGTACRQPDGSWKVVNR